jgi:RNA polymerase sigma factor (sigma-70 family)
VSSISSRTTAALLPAPGGNGRQLRGQTSRERQWSLLVDCMPMLRMHVRRLVGDQEAANEVLQEVSLQILLSDGPTEDVERFLAWSRGVARYVAAHHARARRRIGRQLPFEDELEETPQPTMDPEDHIDARNTLARAVNDLEPESVELLVRRYVLGETGEELAGERSQSPAAVRMRLMRLRATLRSWARGFLVLLAVQSLDWAPAAALNLF